jgi:predicted DCC family thiol-disulfide oxidoreductase YuxK
MKLDSNRDIVIFDGECSLCNGVVGWLLEFAPAQLFEFVPFQSPRGQNLLRYYRRQTLQLDTVIFIDSQGLHTHSDGFLRIVSHIPKWQRVAALLSFVPRLLRDFIYKTASRYRFSLFGVASSCAITIR